ncbi:MAG TPA: glutamate--cysteine ligase [Hellea balneolensis]|uniref:Glutamate--cysteine ligase n=1 Tax=Hellea balneolensis TaxID=287478 RepID=A0A7V5NWQ3_9PROT|nr:glutamate--cysteine ligase [Hellea balneolensis]
MAQTDLSPIEDKAEMVEWIAAGCKPKSSWRIGTEHEKIGFNSETLHPLPYEGGVSIFAMLEGLKKFGWQGVEEGGYLIALKREGASVSLEPGGQFELSGAPLESIHQTCGEVNRHLREVREIAEQIGAGFLSLGFRPVTRLEDVPVMPKGRYKIMRAYMPKVGKLGLEMMFRTCTVQTNLDFSSEADMVKKMRVSLALQPVATALFANSPFKDGKPNGYKSYRSRIWLDTDPARTGMLPFAFEDGFGFERYVDYALDVPMYFVHRGDTYLDASGKSFRDFLNGRLDILPGEKPTLTDFEDHLSTIFPEVRLKQFLEMRGADTGPWSQLCALPAFWVGLLYDEAALDAAWDWVKDWSAEERDRLRRDVPKYGLQTRFRGQTVQDMARRALVLAREGLKTRHRLNAYGESETIFLADLDDMATTGKSNADKLLERYHGAWQGDITRVYQECVF